MNYEKPEVVALACAGTAIQSGEKGQHPVTDLPWVEQTNGAYEADE